MKYLIRDRDARYPTTLDALLTDEDIETVKTSIQMPRMNSIKEPWIRPCRAELLDHILNSAAALRPLPQPITEAVQLDQLSVRRRDQLGGIMHEYQHAA